MMTGAPVLAVAGVLLASSLLIAPPAAAGTIQLVLATRVSMDASGLRVELDLRNRGDDAALAVSPTVAFRGLVVSGESIAALEPTGARTVTFTLPAAANQPGRGRWPVVVRVAYADGGGYHFEAIHVDVAQFGGAAGGADLRVEVRDIRVETETTVTARIDPGGVTAPIRLTFLTPAGVVVSPREQIVAASSRASSVSLTVANVTATTASQLPLVAVAEFDRDGVHDTVTAVSTIEIGPPSEDSRTLVVLSLFVVLVVAWAAIALVTARRRRTRNDR